MYSPDMLQDAREAHNERMAALDALYVLECWILQHGCHWLMLLIVIEPSDDDIPF